MQAKKSKPVIPTSLMYPYVGREVNVILHDGSSHWRRLIGVFESGIVLHRSSRFRSRRSIRICQDDIRSFGTWEDGILMEVSK